MDWPQSTDVVHLHRGARARVLRHEATPTVTCGQGALQALLFDAAQGYVETWADELGLDADALAQLQASLRGTRPARGARLAWLAFAEGQPEGSFFLERDLDMHARGDLTAVLLAARCVPQRDGLALQPGAGLRVVAHVAGGDGDPPRWTVRFTGASAAWPDEPPAARPLAAAPALRPPAAVPAAPVGAETPSLPLVSLDPATQQGDRLAFRPPQEPDTRTPQQLDALMAAALERLPVGIADGDGGAWLHRPGAFEVLAGDDRFGDEAAADVVRRVRPGAPPHLAWPDVWAATACKHAERLFDAFADWGYAPQALLRFVQLPLAIRPLARVHGDHGNAQARWRTDETMAAPALRRRRLELRFGYAPAGVMSLACDPRWIWHEFGHLALAGATGSVELPFAHSIGDALSAVVHDPASPWRSDDPPRGLTFPWVSSDRENPDDGEYVRRHDRQADAGWGWNGARLRGSADDPPRLYRAEQALSSSLFLLYRALGGDSREPATREAAAQHTLHLVWRGLALLGPRALVPAVDADHLASALIDADCGTTAFGNRRGGGARKVVRWAFEQLGLYASSPNAAGEPPDVDLYIDSGRGGDYAPTDLDGTRWRLPGAVAHAEGNRLHLRLTVGNRGWQASSAGTLQAWSAAPDGERLPPWPGPWHALPARGLEPVAGGHRDIVELTLDGADRAVLLAVSCPQDRANTDAATGLPCTGGGDQALAPLVANDNNLALLVR